jgi:DNA repair exonuclease SbcCD nuclease subunit
MRTVILPHDKVNFIWFTDPHFSAIPPGRRGDDYQAALFEKLNFVRDLTERLHGVGICGGDVFHEKKPKHPANSFGLIVGLLHAFRSFPTECVYGSVGNHDLTNDRMDSLASQPLGLLIAAQVYHDLNKEPVLFTNQDQSVKVSLETFPYADGEKTLERLLNAGPRMPGVNFRVGVVHAYGEPGSGGTLFGEPKIGYNQIAHLDFDFLFWGHDHSRKETETVGNITHVNLGSMARAAFSSDEKDRPVVAQIVSFAADGVRVKEKSIPVKPFEAIFVHADKGVEKVGKSNDVLDFLAKMDEAVDGIETGEPREILQTLAADEPKLLKLILELCNL